MESVRHRARLDNIATAVQYDPHRDTITVTTAVTVTVEIAGEDLARRPVPPRVLVTPRVSVAPQRAPETFLGRIPAPDQPGAPTPANASRGKAKQEVPGPSTSRVPRRPIRGQSRQAPLEISDSEDESEPSECLDYVPGSPMSVQPTPGNFGRF